MPGKYTYSIVLDVEDRVSPEIAKIERALAGLENKLKGVSNKITFPAKVPATAQEYVRTLLKSTSEEYARLTKLASQSGNMQKIAAEIAQKGYKSLTKELRKNLELEAQRIEMIKRSGIVVDASTRRQYEAILRLNTALKKHHTVWGKTQNVLGGAFEQVKKVGMGFLTLIGPIFLVDSALHSFQEAISYVLEPFIDFEDALFELRKAANLSYASMAKLGNQLSDLSLITPVAADQLASIAAAAARLGIRGSKDIMEFTKTVAQFASTTVYSSQEAAEALGKISAAFQLPMDSIYELASGINELSNTTASTARDIVEAMKRIGSSGRLIGITADQAAAMAATLIDMGMSAERSGTRIRRALNEIAKNALKINKDISGYFKGWADLLTEDPIRAIKIYLEWINKMDDPLKQMSTVMKHFGTVGGFAMLSLAQNVQKFEKNLETAHQEMLFGSSLLEEYTIAIDRTSAALQLASNRADAARRAFGERLAPVLVSLKNVWADFLWTISGTSQLEELAAEGSKKHLSVISDLTSQMKALGSAADATADVTFYLEMQQKQANEEFAKAMRQTPILATTYERVKRRLAGWSHALALVDEANLRMFRSSGKIMQMWKEQGTLSETLQKDWEELTRTQEAYNKAIQLRAAAEQTKDLELSAKAAETATFYNQKLHELHNKIIKDVEQEASVRARSLDVTQEERATLQDYLSDLSDLHKMRQLTNKEQEITIALAAKQGTLWDAIASAVGESTARQIHNLDELNAALEKLGYMLKEIGGVVHVVQIPRGDIMNIEELNRLLSQTMTLSDKLQIYETELSKLFAEQEYYTRELTRTTQELYNARVNLFKSSVNIGRAYSGIVSSMYNMENIEERLNRLARTGTETRSKSVEEEMRWARITLNRIKSYKDEREEIRKLAEEATTHPRQAGKYIEQIGRLLPDVYRDLYSKMIKARDENDRRSWETTKEHFDEFVKYIQGITIDLPGARKVWEQSAVGVKKLQKQVAPLREMLQNIHHDIEDIHQAMLALPGTSEVAFKNLTAKLQETYALAEEISVPRTIKFDVNDKPVWEAWQEMKSTIESNPITVTFKTNVTLPTFPTIPFGGKNVTLPSFPIITFGGKKATAGGKTVMHSNEATLTTRNSQAVIDNANLRVDRLNFDGSFNFPSNIDMTSNNINFPSISLPKLDMTVNTADIKSVKGKEPTSLKRLVNLEKTGVGYLKKLSKRNVLGSFQTGTSYVPRTGLYVLHQGEAVVPHTQNSRVDHTVTVNIKLEGGESNILSEKDIKELIRTELVKALRRVF